MQLWNLWSPECSAVSKRKIPATLVRARGQNAATKSLWEWCAGSEANEYINQPSRSILIYHRGTRRFGLADSVTGHFGLAISVWGHLSHDISAHKQQLALVESNDYIGRRYVTLAGVITTPFEESWLRLNLNCNYDFEEFVFDCKMSIMI